MLNRITTLREKEQPKAEKPAAEKKQNAKAATRPKSKSPQEYRAEARARDAVLQASYDKFVGLDGIADDQADGDLDSDLAAATRRA